MNTRPLSEYRTTFEWKSCNSATAPARCIVALKDSNILLVLHTICLTLLACCKIYIDSKENIHNGLIPSHLQSTSSSFWSRKSCWRKWCGKSSESFLNSCRPKSVSFSTHLESTRQLDDFRLPWYLNGESCKYNMPCANNCIIYHVCSNML